MGSKTTTVGKQEQRQPHAFRILTNGRKEQRRRLPKLTAGIDECMNPFSTHTKTPTSYNTRVKANEHLPLLRRPSITPHTTPPPTPNLHNLPRSLIPHYLPAMAATESNVKVATHATEPPATSNCDPFVDNTKPRHDRGSLAALMAAIQQVSK